MTGLLDQLLQLLLLLERLESLFLLLALLLRDDLIGFDLVLLLLLALFPGLRGLHRATLSALGLLGRLVRAATRVL